jgi:hypothetical protein
MPPGEFKDRLRESNDPRLAIYEISHEINKLLDEVLWPQIKRIKEPRKQSQYTPRRARLRMWGRRPSLNDGP